MSSRKEKAQVATISAHNDSSIGELVADAVEKVDQEGVISVKEAKGTETIEAGIIDPTKVVRVALENAVSVSSVLLLTEATLTEVPEKQTERAAALEQMSV